MGRCFPLSQVLVLMEPIVDALKYLHAQDPPIVHRDVKPANIIVPTGGGDVVLADFGSAKEYVPGTATTMVGHHSPGYAALEQYRTGTNPSTDIYGLGATLYTLLTGSTPIDSLSRAMGNVSEGVDPLKPANLLKPDIPQVVSGALQRAMSVRMADRFETIEEFWQVFQDCSTEKIPRVPAIAFSQPSPPVQVIESTDTQTLQKEQFAPKPAARVVFRIFAALLVMIAIGLAFFSYRSSLTVLFLCCLGVLLLSLGGLIAGFYFIE